MEHTSINVEGDLDLGDTLGRGWDTNEVEVAEELVIPNEFTFTLEDLDLNSSLTISSCGESLGLLRGDGGIAGNKLRHDTAESLDTYVVASGKRSQTYRNVKTYRVTEE